MDGVRAYWNGEALISRHGKYISCPQWFLDGLSCVQNGTTLDGELWMGRSATHVQITQQLLAKRKSWDMIQYHIYDVPSAVGKTYEERLEIMNNITLPPFAQVVENIKCNGVDHLEKHLAQVVIANGEGLMLRQPRVPYTAGYTSSLLKVKVRDCAVGCVNTC